MALRIISQDYANFDESVYNINEFKSTSFTNDSSNIALIMKQEKTPCDIDYKYVYAACIYSSHIALSKKRSF